MKAPLKVLVAGGSGFIGTRLQKNLLSKGFDVKSLTRGEGTADSMTWDPGNSELPGEWLAGIDIVINLAGANIAASRWSERRRKILRSSRLASTRALVQSISNCDNPPSLFISMSGVNYYAFGTDPKTEEHPPGDSFLSSLCQGWEQEALAAAKSGTRVVTLRMGVVLDPSGGALKKMLPAFHLGMGGPIGTGSQGFPWLTLDALMEIFLFIIETESLSGPVNVVHPHLVTQGEFARELARRLKRPAFFRLPCPIIRLLFGQMGEETLLADLHVRPQKLLQHGYSFKEPDLAKSLESLFA